MATTEHWTEAPDDHDYPAAEDYLSLLVSPKAAHRLAGELEAADIEHRKAKDLLRASALPILAPDNVHVAKDLAEVKKGKLLSPVLLLRGRLDAQVPLTVADGYHRTCAAFLTHEDTLVPGRIVSSSSTMPDSAQPHLRLIFSASGTGVRRPTAMSLVKWSPPMPMTAVCQRLPRS